MYSFKANEEGAQILMRLNEHNKPTGQKGNIYVRYQCAGLQIRFFGDGPVFYKYLESKVLVIDVWDGESLLQIGELAVKIYVTCRIRWNRIKTYSKTKERCSNHARRI